MSNKGRRLIEFMINPDVMDVILEYSSEQDVSIGKALNRIVQEWRENKEIEPLKIPPKLSDLEQLEQKLKNCQLDVEVLKRELRLAKL